MEPKHSTGIVVHEGRLTIKYGDRSQDCLCRVTFDPTRSFHVVIDCLESVHELLGGPLWFQSDRKFQISVPGTKNPLDCGIHGSVRQQVIGSDPSVYPSFTPLGDSTLVDLGFHLYRA